MSEQTPEEVLAMYADAVKWLSAGLPIVTEIARGDAMVRLWSALSLTLEAAKAREEALTLPNHRCEMLAAAQWNDVGGRAHWVGRLLEPIPGYEEETHCLHFRTPLKGEVVFGMIEADFHQLAALCEAASSYPINPHWLALKARDFIGNARFLRQEGVPEAQPPADSASGGSSGPDPVAIFADLPRMALHVERTDCFPQAEEAVMSWRDWERVCEAMKALMTCDCGRPLGKGACSVCDSDRRLA